MSKESPLDALRLAPRADVVAMAEAGHLVQFYDDDRFLLDTVSRYIALGVEAGAGGVVIATKPHLEGIEDRLKAHGIDVAAACEQGWYLPFDAAETLSAIMEGRSPSEQRFMEVVARAIESAGNGRRAPVRAFGEMVSLLWAEGNAQAALRVEELWNRLRRTHDFTLLCAYPMRGFGRAPDGAALRQVCAEHTAVAPTEAYSALPTADERLRLISELQHKANVLEAEIAERRDIETALREQERQAQAARAEAENVSRMKDEFLATLSHELRTPLNAILGWIRMLRGGSLTNGDPDRALEVIERNTYNLSQLVSDLLDVSRIITGKMTLNIGSVDLVHVIGIVIDSLRPAAEARRITIRPVLDHRVRPLLADADRLQQVIWNLLSNAVKFTPEGGRVDVRLNSLPAAAQITVTDTGKGISPDFLPHLFERFRQADSTTTRAHAGLGLGLAIVRHIVELHGGTVRAESRGPGQGATFVLDLPYGLSRDLASTRPLSAVQAEPVAMPSEALRGLRAVIVDDSADTCDLITAILRQQGAEVRSASSAREALALVNAAAPDVLVCDIAMPGVDGYELIRQLRSRAGAACGIPAVALTAYARPEDRERALAAGFDGHVAKPVEPAEFIKLVAQLAESQRARRAATRPSAPAQPASNG